jgi:endo-1,3-1,4-beta-glycanase ExoK
MQIPKLNQRIIAQSCALAVLLLAPAAGAVASGELYTTSSYGFGRFEARIQFAFGDGVVSSFFLWKDGSEQDGVFWNELDFEKLRADCELETNALYGDPESSHNQTYEGVADLCGAFHTYAYEWTPEYIAWSIDGVEIRREAAETATAYAVNAAEGMQLRFNIWPGDSSFGGEFDEAILPVHQYVNWVQYSAYVDGAFQPQWREDFDAVTIPSSFSTGSWPSPKNLSTHASANISFAGGYAIVSLTADDATGAAGAMPVDLADVAPPAAASSESVPNTPATGSEMPSASSIPSIAPSEPAASVMDDDGEDDASCQLGGGVRAGSWLWATSVLALLLRFRRKSVCC